MTQSSYDACHRKNLNFSQLLENGPIDLNSPLWATNETVGCSSFEYDYTDIPYESIASEVKVFKFILYIKTVQ